jgi:IS30 family transposase
MEGKRIKANVPYTLEERIKIQEMIEQKYSYHSINKMLNRGCPKAIKREVEKNGGRKNYNAQEAQKYADTVFERRLEGTVRYWENVGEKGREEHSQKMKDVMTSKYNAPLSSILMQIDILMDEIKKIKEKIGGL